MLFESMTITIAAVCVAGVLGEVPIIRKLPTCLDFDTWTSSNGDSCNDFEAKQYCTDGKVGHGWNPDWGEIKEFASNGMDAHEACCSCGGGYVPFPEDVDHPSMRPDLLCISHPIEWKNKVNESCDAYSAFSYCTADGEAGVGWDVSQRGKLSSFDPAIPANIACCECGGGRGVNRGTYALAEAAKFKAEGCTDDDEWRDERGGTCVDYSIQKYCAHGMVGVGWRPELWGSFDDATDSSNVTASQACCACGGGARVEDVLVVETIVETDNGNDTNVNANDNANDNSNTDTTSAIAITPIVYGCVDHPVGWSDGAGDTCDVYTQNLYCDTTGSVGYGWGLDLDGEDWGARATKIEASTACCGCGGGRRVTITGMPEVEEEKKKVHKFCVNAPIGWQTEENDTCVTLKGACSAEGARALDSHLKLTGEVLQSEFISQDGVSNTLGCCACGGGANESMGLTIYFGQDTDHLLYAHNLRLMLLLEKGVADVIVALFEDDNVTHTVFESVGLLGSSMLAVKFNETRLQQLSLDEEFLVTMAKEISAYRFRFKIGSDTFAVAHAHLGVLPVSSWQIMADIGRQQANESKNVFDESEILSEESNTTPVRAEIIVCAILAVLVIATAIFLLKRRHTDSHTISGRHPLMPDSFDKESPPKAMAGSRQTSDKSRVTKKGLMRWRNSQLDVNNTNSVAEANTNASLGEREREDNNRDTNTSQPVSLGSLGATSSQNANEESFSMA